MATVSLDLVPSLQREEPAVPALRLDVLEDRRNDELSLFGIKR
jgi:hypothetical protein